MPQLRDSGDHGATRQFGMSPQFEGFARIFGVETEYGVSVTGAGQPVDAAQVAMMMFQPVVSRARSTNTYLVNGSRLYLDVGSHPEYATAEARDPMDALAQDLAGELVMTRLAVQAQHRLRERYGDGVAVHLFKNNADSAGHSFGCHENYLVRRYVPLETVEHQLLPFLITRQLYTGAGRVVGDRFEITQRADFLDEAVSSATTRSRPMVNTRDEPHADPDEFRRLHVIIGDSNRSQWATWMKLAVTHLVLCVIEESARLGVPSGLECCALADPGEANRAVSRDLTCRTALLRLADADGLRRAVRAVDDDDASSISPLSGDTAVTALALQRYYLAVVRRFMREHASAMDAAMPATTATRIVAEWQTVLDSLEHGDTAALASRVDWAAKRRLFDALRRRDPGIAAAQLERLDMDYHDIVNGRLYPSLVARGVMTTLLDDASIKRAAETAPADTRAALRGAFVARALERGSRFSCDWTRLTLGGDAHTEAVLIDPFDSESTPEYRRLMDLL
ncbi:proteasome accessory factor PafA2 family protein [Bifidobacterium leontopitheci]|uniref:Pup--protein ligase n=1 Tax=Bifidobacterium leontopitheci TaxID=2650774 RepID=A0A6I1GKU0_9BIFI|nr:proteasome accessory factor PafA2 family protein [Bifidobacterium leontopitheci]KAB7791402.1 Pup--protein ligase [Bifidobacterium leontopitheci]